MSTGLVPLENRILALTWAFPILRRLAQGADETLQRHRDPRAGGPQPGSSMSATAGTSFTL
jgi:hypothetical protein